MSSVAVAPESGLNQEVNHVNVVGWFFFLMPRLFAYEYTDDKVELEPFARISHTLHACE